MLVVGPLPWGSAPLYPSLSPNPVTFRDLVWVTVVEGGGEPEAWLYGSVIPYHLVW